MIVDSSAMTGRPASSASFTSSVILRCGLIGNPPPSVRAPLPRSFPHSRSARFPGRSPTSRSPTRRSAPASTLVASPHATPAVKASPAPVALATFAGKAETANDPEAEAHHTPPAPIVTKTRSAPVNRSRLAAPSAPAAPESSSASRMLPLKAASLPSTGMVLCFWR